MVRTDILRPGDVLLSRSSGLLSALTTFATANGNARRRYSHAALVLQGGSWFESSDNGVAFLYKRVSKTEKHGTELWRLVDVSDFVHFDVYRHPLLERSHPPSELAQLIIKLTRHWVGREYPPLRRLAGATPLLPGLPRFKRILGDIKDKYDEVRFKLPRVVAPGPFCSELVVRIYRELALELNPKLTVFVAPRSARLISPNDLADPEISTLRIVNDAIVYEDSGISDCRAEYISADLEN